MFTRVRWHLFPRPQPASVIPARVAAAREESRILFTGTPKNSMGAGKSG
jgi:hypothetical protein